MGMFGTPGIAGRVRAKVLRDGQSPIDPNLEAARRMKTSRCEKG